MGGVGLQQFFICCFVGLAIRFQRQMQRDTPLTDQSRAFRMLYVLYAVLTLITVSRAPSHPEQPFPRPENSHHFPYKYRSVSSSAWPNTPKATKAASRCTKRTSTSSTPPSCSSPSCSSTSSIRAASCRVKTATCRVGSRGRLSGRTKSEAGWRVILCRFTNIRVLIPMTRERLRRRRRGRLRHPGIEGATGSIGYVRGCGGEVWLVGNFGFCMRLF